MTRAIVLCLTLASTALQAQQHPLVGAWRVTYPAGARHENGEMTVIMGTASLTLASKGDSLVGTLTPDSTPGLPARPPVQFAAPAKPGEVVFVTRSKATININGDTRDAISMSTWTLTVKGDSLTGTMARTIIGADVPPQQPAPVTGVRVGR